MLTQRAVVQVIMKLVDCRFPSIQTPENSDKSEESVGEETGNEDESAHLSSSTTRAVSGALASSTETAGMEDHTGSLGLLPQTAIRKPTTCNKNNQRTKPELFRDILSQFNLQPRIVLEPIMIKFKHREVPIEVASPQHDSQSEVELDNIGGPLAVESSEGKNTECQQEEDNDCYFSGVTEKTAINQLPLIIIDDEPEQTNARTAAEHAQSECGRMKCDSKCYCNNISTMKLTVMPQTSDLRSLFKKTSSGDMQKKTDSESACVVLSDGEENVDEDVLNSSRGLDEKKIASVPSVQNVQSDVGSNPGENSSSDFIFPAPDALESINTDESTCVHDKSIDSASEHTDVEVVTSERNDQSISTDPLTRDQMASITIRQTEDNPMSSMENKSCQTSNMVFAGHASKSEVNDDMKLLEMEIVSGDETKNKKL